MFLQKLASVYQRKKIESLSDVKNLAEIFLERKNKFYENYTELNNKKKETLFADIISKRKNVLTVRNNQVFKVKGTAF